MKVWVTWLMFRTSEYARLIDAKIKPLSSKSCFVKSKIKSRTLDARGILSAAAKTAARAKC